MLAVEFSISSGSITSTFSIVELIGVSKSEIVWITGVITTLWVEPSVSALSLAAAEKLKITLNRKNAFVMCLMFCNPMQYIKVAGEIDPRR